MEPVTQQQETVTKQKNPLRIEQGRKLVEYDCRKKEDLKHLNKQITKQDDIIEHKPKPNMNNYVYAGSLSVLGLAIGGYLIGYTMLGRTLIKMRPPSLSKFDIEDGVKLVVIIALSDFTMDYLIKQKIIPNNI